MNQRKGVPSHKQGATHAPARTYDHTHPHAPRAATPSQLKSRQATPRVLQAKTVQPKAEARAIPPPAVPQKSQRPAVAQRSASPPNAHVRGVVQLKPEGVTGTSTYRDRRI